MSASRLAPSCIFCDIPTKACFTDRKAIRTKAQALLEKLDIAGLMDRTIDSLAASEQYMVEFAKALMAEPDVLIIDEITSALYNTDVEKVQQALHELKQNGCIILFISHRLSEIYAI